MSDSLALQVDIGSLSLTSFGALSNILAALSADDVQPIAMIQLQNLGAAFHVSGPITRNIPDHLQRFHSTRIERLGIAVDWRKGDFASLMAQSIGGQASSLLAVFLCNLFKDSAGNILHGASSKGLLPRYTCLCSPSQLERAAQLLANKLAVVAVGTLVANQVCRIHEAYRQLHQSVPINLLDNLSEEGMVELLVKISFALRKENSMVRIQGTCCMGYIVTLVVSLFADDSIVTIEGLVIHGGSHSSSIAVDIVANLGKQPTQVETMDTLNSLNEILSSAQFSGADVGLKRFCGPSLSHQSFAWKGLISARLTTLFQQWDLVCSLQVITAIGVCALSIADITYLDLELGCRRESFSEIIKSPVTDLLGKNHRAIMHDLCKIVTGVLLPRTWPLYSEAFTRLEELMMELMETIPEDSSCATYWES